MSAAASVVPPTVPSAPATPPPSPLVTAVRWTVYLVVLLTPFLFTWVNEELFEFPKMLLVYGLVGIGVSLALIDHTVRQDWHWPKTRFNWFIAAFVASQLLATIFSIHPRTSWLGYYTRFNGGLLSTLTFVGLYYLVVRYFSVKQLVTLSKILVVGGVVAAAYAFPEHFGHSPSCVLITNNFNVSCWVQDVKSRVFGTFGQPNWLAAYLITLMPISLMWFEQTRQKLWRILYGLSWVIMLSVLLFTKSRSGLGGLGIGLTIWGGLQAWQYAIHHLENRLGKHSLQRALTGFTHPIKTQAEWKWLVGLAVLTLVIIGQVGTPWTSTFSSWWQNHQTRSNAPHLANPAPAATPPAGTALERGGTESGEIRKIVWSGAIAVWRRYPLFGSGVETFAYSYYQDRPMSHNLISEWDFLYNKAHNELLNYLATTGIVGLGSYLALWIAMGWFVVMWLRQPIRSDLEKTTRALAIAWVAGLSAQFVSNFLGFSTVMVNVLFWVGLACLAQFLSFGTSITPAVSHTPLTPNFRLPKFFTIILILGVTFAGSYFLFQINRWWTADRDYALSKALFQAGQYEQAAASLESALKEVPDEALFWDQLASQYSLLASSLKATPQASTSADAIKTFAQTAVYASDYTLHLNPRHLDFYKTRSRVFISLAAVDPTYLVQAEETLQAAMALSPTDPKLVYNLGLVQIARNNTSAGIANLELAVKMKPDYLTAWFDLGKAYEQASQSAKALETYQHILINVSPDNPDVTARAKTLLLNKNLP